MEAEPDNLSKSLGSCCEGGRAILSRPAAHSAPEEAPPLHHDTALYAVEREAQQDYFNNPPEGDGLEP